MPFDFSPLSTPLLAAVNPVAPWLIFAIAVLGGVAVALLLPGRKSVTWNRLGGVLLLAAVGVLVATIINYAAKTAPGSTTGVSYIFFWLFAGLALLGAVRVITHAQPVYSALYFVLTVFASAGLFVLLWAEFIAAALVLIYAGAILVTYVFVIMLAAEATPTSGKPAAAKVLAEYDRVSREPIVSTIAGFALLGVLLFVIFDKAPNQIGRNPYTIPAAEKRLPADQQYAMARDVNKPSDTDAPKPIVTGNSQALGFYLFDQQMVGIQIAGLLLTLSMVGAIVIARKKIILPQGDRAEADEVVNSPATPVDDNPHSIPVIGTMDPAQKAYPET